MHDLVGNDPLIGLTPRNLGGVFFFLHLHYLFLL